MGMKDAGFSASQLKVSGANISQIMEAGFSGAQLKEAGFTASQMIRGGDVFKFEPMRFTLAQLNQLGFSAPEVNEAGICLLDLYMAGFNMASFDDSHRRCHCLVCGLRGSRFSACWNK